VKKPTRSGGNKHLDGDDHALWSHTTRSVKPLSRIKGRHHQAFERAEEVAGRSKARVPPTKTAHESNGKAIQAKASSLPKAESPAKASLPPIAQFDRKHVRKIRSGQVEIEARIDLHGMRQDEAHAALTRFLHRCQSKGQRWVLVITGKGRAADADRYSAFDMTSSRQRGVLRLNVPRWLDEPQLRPLVVSYTTAALSHGGEGALYVHLRKLR
jgi:DNA-nicking Smr family endonuclease